MSAQEDRIRRAIEKNRTERRDIQVRRNNCGTQVILETPGIGTPTYYFTRHLDDKWRLNSVWAYGNGSNPIGEGCDASGYVVIAKDIIIALEKLVAERA